MSLPFEEPAQCQAPPGKWRVVEMEFGGRHPLRLIGDYDTFQQGSYALRNARWPNQYALYDDLGRQVMVFAPGSEGQPLCGPES